MFSGGENLFGDLARCHTGMSLKLLYMASPDHPNLPYRTSFT
jgi:hypothetical protein